MRRRNKKRAPKPIPIKRVRSIEECSALGYWLRGLPQFDCADAFTSKGGEPAVAIKRGGVTFAGCVCASVAIAKCVEGIATAIVIRREDGWEEWAA